MPITEFLYFTGPDEVDWQRTENNILKQLNHDQPDMRLADKAIIVAETVVELKKLIVIRGTQDVYDEVQKLNSK